MQETIEEEPSVTATFLDTLDTESSLSSSPHSSTWDQSLSRRGGAHSSNTADDSSSTAPSSVDDGYDDDDDEKGNNSGGHRSPSSLERGPASFSTTSLRDALDAIDAAASSAGATKPVKSSSLPPINSDTIVNIRAPLHHSLSEPTKPGSHDLGTGSTDQAGAAADKTPVAGSFSFAPFIPRSAFISDPEPGIFQSPATPIFSTRSPFASPSNIRGASPTTGPPPPPPLIIPVAVRPSFSHRKTHSGSVNITSPLTASSSGGFHKRVANPASSSIRLVPRRQSDVAALAVAAAVASQSGTGWSSEDVEGLEEAGFRVHDFRDEADIPPSATIAPGTTLNHWHFVSAPTPDATADEQPDTPTAASSSAVPTGASRSPADLVSPGSASTTSPILIQSSNRNSRPSSIVIGSPGAAALSRSNSLTRHPHLHHPSLSRSNSGRGSRHGRTSSKSFSPPTLASSSFEDPTRSILPSAPPTKRSARSMSGDELLRRMTNADNAKGKGIDELPLLVVDVRSLSAFLGDSGRIKSSVNVNFPSLLIKRFRKGNAANFSLNAFITTEHGKALFQSITKTASPSGTLNGVDVVVIDQKAETRDPASTSPGSVLLSVLERRDDIGTIYYLPQPFHELVGQENWKEFIMEGEGDSDEEMHLLDDSPPEAPPPTSGLLTLQPSGPSSSLPTSKPPNILPRLASNGPLRTPPLSGASTPPLLGSRTPSPQTPNGTPRPRAPKLRRIDTSDDLLGKRNHHVAQSPTKPGAAKALRVDSQAAQRTMSVQALCHQQSKSPSHTATRFNESDLNPPSAPLQTAKPSQLDSPSTPVGAGDTPPFIVSTIIPGFLYLGPEPTRPEDLDELQDRGVKQILNLALECEDTDGEISRRFERYWKIPMRDFVEEVGVQKSIEDACRILSDAQLQSKPVYCHCRAGKSRSVTIVLAYLVHRNNWSLKRAYAHVSERRKGISPNIGFVAELMRWEERERGGKSHGVFGANSNIAPAPPTLSHAATASAAYFPTIAEVGEDSSRPSRGGRGRIRDSLPPGAHLVDLSGIEGEKEMEVRATDGTWAPARRDPRDENSNPLRRASRAGLESVPTTGTTSWGD
ncbi:hypothetical protein T439DRAFT_81833 [Meredithblackwellia eburnea MCA 4105]